MELFVLEMNTNFLLWAKGVINDILWNLVWKYSFIVQPRNKKLLDSKQLDFSEIFLLNSFIHSIGWNLGSKEPGDSEIFIVPKKSPLTPGLTAYSYV